MPRIGKCYGVGQALFDLMPPPIGFENAPTSLQDNYSIGQLAYSPLHSPTNFYIYAGGGVWDALETGLGAVNSVTGTANQVLASPTTGDVIVSLIGPYTPATYTAHGVLIGEGTSSIVATTPGTNGQVLTGNTGADPSFQALGTNSGLTTSGVVIAKGAGAFVATSAGTSGQVLTSNGAGVDPTFQAAASGGLTFNAVAGTTQAMVANNGYYTQNAGQTTLTLPVTCVAGALMQVQGVGAGGWIIAQNAGQSIQFLSATTTTGVTGTITSATGKDGITILCIVANTTFIVTGSVGNFTLA